MKYNNLIFDLGNVLFHLDFTSTVELIKKHYTDHDQAEDIMKKVIRGADFEDFNKGRISERQYFLSCREYLWPELQEQEFWKHYTGIFRPNLALIEKLPLLAQKSDLFVLSNTDSAHIAFLENRYPETFSFFKGKVYSYQVGLMKPDVEIYEYILNQYELDPQSTVFIDDLPENIKAAQSCGMEGVLFTSTQQALAQIFGAENAACKG